MGFKTLAVTAQAPSTVATELRRRLSTGPTRLATGPGAEATLTILAENADKTIQTLTGTGRVFDYLLRLRVEFRVADAAGRAILEPTAIEVRRLITYSETAPLAKEAEERLLYDDMRAEAADGILRRIAVVRAGVRP